MSHTEALRKIVKICKDSSQFNRRTQACLNTALISLGYTEGQRKAVFIECAQRTETYRDKCATEGKSAAAKWFKEVIQKDTGEKHVSVKHEALGEYV